MEANPANNQQTENGHGKGTRTKTNQYRRNNNSQYTPNKPRPERNRQSQNPYQGQNQQYQGQDQQQFQNQHQYAQQNQSYQGQQDNQYQNQQYQGQNYQGHGQNFDARSQGHGQNFDARSQGHNQNFDARSQGQNPNFEARSKNPNQSRGTGKRRGGGGYNNRGGEEYQEGNPQQHRGRTRGANLSNDPKIVWLRERTNAYFPDENIFKTLEQYQGDLELALQALKVSRENSWSNVVVKSSSHYGYQQSHEDGLQQDQPDMTQVDHQDYYQPPRKPPRHRKNQIKAQEPIPPKEEEEVYNADAKIEAIQQALEHQLSAMESKADELKRLQEEIRKIKADRDVQIEQLSTEKETLTLKFEQLKQDLEKTQHRIYAIDGEVTNLKQEKVDRIRSLEERTRVLLEDKSA